MYVVTCYNHDEYEVIVLGVTKDYEKAKEILEKEKQCFIENYGLNDGESIIEENYLYMLGENDEPLCEVQIHNIEEV